MKFRNSLQQMLGDTRRQIDEMFVSFEESLADVDRQVDEAERVATEAGRVVPGEVVTTRREEVRPDGTRVVTMVTCTRFAVTKDGRP